MTKAVQWDSEEEWALELRAMRADEKTPFVDISDLINDLWYNYCVAKEIEPAVIDLKNELEYCDTVGEYDTLVKVVRDLVKAYDESFID